MEQVIDHLVGRVVVTELRRRQRGVGLSSLLGRCLADGLPATRRGLMTSRTCDATGGCALGAEHWPGNNGSSDGGGGCDVASRLQNGDSVSKRHAWNMRRGCGNSDATAAHTPFCCGGCAVGGAAVSASSSPVPAVSITGCAC